MKNRIGHLVVMALVTTAILVVPLAMARDDDERDRREFRNRREHDHRDRDRRSPGEREAAERREREEHRHREERELAERRRHEEHREREFAEHRRHVERASEEMELSMHMIGRTAKICFSPEVAAMIAIGALKDQAGRDPREAIEQLEDLLEDTRTLGLRNAIRLNLKDLYQATEQRGKLIRMLREMVSDNDEALSDEEDRDDDDDDDDDGDDDDDD